MTENELAELKRVVAAKRKILKGKMAREIADTFKEYPWGIVPFEFVQLLMNKKTEGTNLSDDVRYALHKIEIAKGPDIFESWHVMTLREELNTALKQKRGRGRPPKHLTSINEEISVRMALIGTDDRAMHEKLHRIRNDSQSTMRPQIKRILRKYKATPEWDTLWLGFLSDRFKLGKKCSMRGITDRRFHNTSEFFAPSEVHAWARLFLEIDEDTEHLQKEKRVGRAVGYNILTTLIDGPEVFTRLARKLKIQGSNYGPFKQRLDVLQKKGFILLTTECYSLSPLTEQIFEHIDKYRGTEKDVRKWAYRANIFYPKEEPSE